MADVNVVNDVDGVYYVAGSQGEPEEDLAHRNFFVHQADVGAFTLGTEFDTTAAGAGPIVMRALRINYWLLLACTGLNRAVVTPLMAMRIAFLRVLCLTKGLIDTTLNIAAHHVSYSDVKIRNGAAQITWNDGTADVDIASPIGEEIPNWLADAPWRAKVKKQFANLVCIVAYFFRIRAHHWVEDMNDRYAAVWRRCLYNEDDCGVIWQLVAHHALHAIYPDTLDDFWTVCKNTARCAGTLIKRYTSLPAGVAVVGAVRQGAIDLAVVFPAMRIVLKESYDELDRCLKLIQGRTWVGSVNRRFYDAPDCVVDETKLAALAAIIIAALSNSANNAVLANSPALKRVAGQAPITGNTIAQVMQKATQDDRMVDSLFIEGEEEE